jgi:hypothetical protein
MLAIEIDGDSHEHVNAAQDDKVRQKRLESLGVSFLRFDDLDVKRNMGWVLDEIMNYIGENEPTPNPSREGNWFCMSLRRIFLRRKSIRTDLTQNQCR